MTLSCQIYFELDVLQYTLLHCFRSNLIFFILFAFTVGLKWSAFFKKSLNKLYFEVPYNYFNSLLKFNTTAALVYVRYNRVICLLILFSELMNTSSTNKGKENAQITQKN